jgi:hypothetical protein
MNGEFPLIGRAPELVRVRLDPTGAGALLEVKPLRDHYVRRLASLAADCFCLPRFNAGQQSRLVRACHPSAVLSPGR